MGTVDLTYTGLAVGMLLMLIPFYFLWRFRTGLLSSALWGTVRMTVQLLLIGVYLRFLFQWDNEWVNVLWMAVMAVLASHTAVSRTALRREVLLLPVFTGFLATVLLVSLYFLAFVVRADDVFAARFFIPVAGVRSAVIKSFSPCIANMAVLGIVSFPGTMIGQILGGSMPEVAIKYQLMISVITVVASMLSLVITISLSVRRTFDEFGRLKPIFRKGRNTK